MDETPPAFGADVLSAEMREGADGEYLAWKCRVEGLPRAAVPQECR